MAVPQAQDIAMAVVRDGSENWMTERWANIGTGGLHAGNMNRDFESLMRSEGWSNYVEPYMLALSFKDPEGGIQPIDFPILLPHEMLNALYHLNIELFYQIWIGDGGVSGILEFWEMAFQNMPHLWNHPYARKIRETPSLSLPFRLWGDEAPLTKHHSLGLFSISPVLTTMPSMSSRLLLYLYISGQLQSFDEIWDTLIWSFECLGEGIMPTHDHKKKRLAPSSGKRFRLMGQEIAGGLMFFLAQVVGDVKHICETFGFDHIYHKANICFLCRAHRHRGLFSAFDFRPDAPWTLTMVLHEAYMRDIGQYLRVTRLPGFNIGCIQLDMMHILALGLLQIVLGSIFWNLCERKFFIPGIVGPWKHRFSAQLEVAFRDFSNFCRANNINCSQRPFTIGRLSLKNLGSRPVFKSKASNTFKVAKWMSNICVSIASANPSDVNRAQSACIWAYVQFVDVCRCAPLWRRDSDRRELEFCRKTALFAHSVLAHEANAGRIPANLWATKPKCHYFDHLARKCLSEKLNPCNHWVFADEDFIGRIVRIVHHVGGSTRRLLAATLRYLVRMHCSFREWYEPVPDLDSIA